MSVTESQKEMPDDLNRRLEALQQELATMNQAVEQVLSRRRKPKPALIFPFSMLDWLIQAGLLSLERLVRRLVTAVVR